MKKTISYILLVTLLLTGCGSRADKTAENLSAVSESVTPIDGGSVNLFCDSPDTLNPITTGFKSVSDVMGLVYEGLFQVENNFSATPVLASGYSTEADNTVYIVRLKKKVKFHDGSELDTGDVVATFNRIMSVESKYKTALTNVKSCYQSSDGAVVFELYYPMSNFVNLLDFPILPSELTDGDFASPNESFIPNGTGKYEVRMKDATGITLIKSRGYDHGEEPYVEDIYIKYMKDTSIAKYNFEAVETDFITTDLYSWGDTAMNGAFSTYEYESNRLTFLGINCANPVLADKEVRKIISRAVNKEKLVSDILYTHGATADYPVNPNAYFASGNLLADRYEAGETMNLLKTAGWLDLDGDGVLDKYVDDVEYSMSFHLVLNSGNTNAELLADMLRSAFASEGIKLTVSHLDYWSYIDAVQNGNYDLFIGRTDIANDCNISFMLGSGGYQNFYRFSSQNMDNALYRISVSSGENDIKSAYKEFEFVFRDEMPIIPLYFETDAVFTSTRIKGDPHISRTGIFTGFDKVYVKFKE